MTIPLQKNITKEASRKVERKFKDILLSGNYLPDDDSELCIESYIDGVMPYDEGFLMRVGCFASSSDGFKQIPPQAIESWKAQKEAKEAAVANVPLEIREALETLYNFYSDIDEWREEDTSVYGLNTYDDIVREAVLPCPMSDAEMADEDSDDSDEDGNSVRYNYDQIIFHVYRRYTDDHIELLKKSLAAVEAYALSKTNNEGAPSFNEYATGTTLRGIAFLSDLLGHIPESEAMKVNENDEKVNEEVEIAA